YARGLRRPALKRTFNAGGMSEEIWSARCSSHARLLLQNDLARDFGADDFTKLAAILVALHLNLIGAFGLLGDRIGLFFVRLDRRQARVLSHDQHVPCAAVIHR